ncbi:MAG: ATP-binding cassette domain-containing protein [Parasphingorhabdus sp.]|uniref:ABC transporter ATP-binding protein n=1 Tax=Parasphingorhabdus sp. TaxID=2709688 RepID=UPI003299AA98
MLLEIENLDYNINEKPLFSGFKLSIEEQNHHLLTGPSGSGKTTLIHLICGLLSPEKGAIRVAGHDMAAISESGRDKIRREHIGIVFQTLRLVSALDLSANLLLAQRLSRGTTDAPLIASLLERLGIAHRAKAKPHQLSQGEAQRAAIARALVTRPRLLIADEPTSALDEANAGQVADLLLECAADYGVTLLIATHDDRLTPLFPNRIALTEHMLKAA